MKLLLFKNLGTITQIDNFCILTSDEGLQVAQRMLLDSPDKVSVIRKLVLQMNDTGDARNLIQSLLENDRTEMLRLKRDFGASLRPILGNPNGYYVLDLSKEMDRMCLEKLLEISTTAGNKRMENSKLGYGRVGDLSQKGNWSSFRNELMNGEPVVLSPAFAQPIPLSGKLEFDFSGAGRPNRDALVVSDIRVVKILMNNGLLHPHDTPVALYKMSVLAQAAEKVQYIFLAVSSRCFRSFISCFDCGSIINVFLIEMQHNIYRHWAVKGAITTKCPWNVPD